MSLSRSVLKDFIVGLRHVGHVVEDLERSVDSFRRLYGVDDVDITWVPANGEASAARLAFINVAGVEFQLIQPVSEDLKRITAKLSSGPAGIHHVAYQVDDITGALEALAKRGIQPGHVTPEGIVDTGHSRIVFLDPDHTEGLLVELVEIYPK